MNGSELQKMWILCAEKELDPGDLRKKANIPSAMLTKLKKNQEVALSVLLKIADVLHCNAGDIMEFVDCDKATEENHRRRGGQS